MAEYQRLDDWDEAVRQHDQATQSLTQDYERTQRDDGLAMAGATTAMGLSLSGVAGSAGVNGVAWAGVCGSAAGILWVKELVDAHESDYQERWDGLNHDFGHQLGQLPDVQVRDDEASTTYTSADGRSITILKQLDDPRDPHDEGYGSDHHGPVDPHATAQQLRPDTASDTDTDTDTDTDDEPDQQQGDDEPDKESEEPDEEEPADESGATEDEWSGGRTEADAWAGGQEEPALDPGSDPGFDPSQPDPTSEAGWDPSQPDPETGPSSDPTTDQPGPAADATTYDPGIDPGSAPDHALDQTQDHVSGPEAYDPSQATPDLSIEAPDPSTSPDVNPDPSSSTDAVQTSQDGVASAQAQPSTYSGATPGSSPDGANDSFDDAAASSSTDHHAFTSSG